MLTIGEFAGMTGLSIKALRHYADKGVLIPAEVVAGTGYRLYREDQVRNGVVIRALRDAGVPLAEVAETVRNNGAAAALGAHRAHVAAEREREDLAFTQAEQTIAALAAPVEIIERSVAAQPYVGRVITIDESLTDEDANAQFAELFAAVQQAGVGPVGPFWTTIRPGENGEVVIVCCWPTSTKLETGWGGSATTVDVLPHRTELAAIWTPAGGEELPEGSTHPAVVALFDAIGARDLAMPGVELRQRVLGETEQSYAVEVSITLPS